MMASEENLKNFAEMHRSDIYGGIKMIFNHVQHDVIFCNNTTSSSLGAL
jgi:hypothetical protein